MRGSAAFRVAVAPGGALAGPWVQNSLWTAARAVPSLDLRFADNKSLVDATTGASLVTFTRASSGTFVGSNGVLQTAVTNLVLRSEEFDNAGWTKTRSSVTANAITAPNGTLTADEIIEDTTATNTHNIGQSISFISGTTYTVSVFAKATALPRFLQIVFPSSAFTTNKRPVFDLVNGTALAAVDTTASIENIGNGWFRCVASTQATTTVSASIQLQLANTYTVGSGSSIYTGDGTSGIYLWGAQLEQASTVGEYIPTTSTINSAPRFDHNPTTGESLGLLVEEARTNLILQSEDFSDSITWVRTSSSVTANAATAPDGTTTADKLIVNNGIASLSARITQTIVKAASATTYTYTVFAKTGESGTGTLQIIFTDTATTSNSATSSFSTVSGTITGAASAQGTFTNASSTIIAFANGWYRCSLTVTTSTETSVQSRIYSRLPTTGNGTSGLLIWGAQLEAASFPTSYIPTTSATVTRAADVASITGTNFSSFYNQTEGTVFADNTNYGVSNSRIASFSDNSTSNRFIVGRGSGSGGNINYFVAVGGVTQVSSLILASSLSFGLAAKVAVAVKASDFAGSANGLAPVTQATGSMPTTLSQLTIGNGETLGLNMFSGTIKRLTYWPVRLATPTLVSITQP